MQKPNNKKGMRKHGLEKSGRKKTERIHGLLKNGGKKEGTVKKMVGKMSQK